MPWEKDPLDQKVRFVTLAEKRKELGVSFAELCRSFGISRQCGYEWLGRWQREGANGLRERSRVARHRPHALDDEALGFLLALKEKHPNWGAKKVRSHIKRFFPERACPAVSTIHELFRREGRVRRRARPRFNAKTPPGTKPRWANHVWGADYKGWFLLGNGARCDPFTLTDLFSRKGLVVDACKVISKATAWRGFEWAFLEYGLPDVVRSDGGPPFGARTTGVSAITLRLLKIGVRHEFSRPGTPTDNGCHERFHRTLGEDTLPPAGNHRAQQRRFNRFLEDFNAVRPHESLGDLCPDDVYESSRRRITKGELRDKLAERFIYEGWFETRPVARCGTVMFRNERLYIGEPLGGELIGFEPIGHDVYNVWVGPLLLGVHHRGSGELIRGDINTAIFTRAPDPDQPDPQS